MQYRITLMMLFHVTLQQTFILKPFLAVLATERFLIRMDTFMNTQRICNCEALIAYVTNMLAVFRFIVILHVLPHTTSVNENEVVYNHYDRVLEAPEVPISQKLSTYFAWKIRFLMIGNMCLEYFLRFTLLSACRTALVKIVCMPQLLVAIQQVDTAECTAASFLIASMGFLI